MLEMAIESMRRQLATQLGEHGVAWSRCAPAGFPRPSRDECTASAAVAGSVVTSTSPSAATAAFTAQPRSATLITRDRNAREASR
jgi:hypothetical protein